MRTTHNPVGGDIHSPAGHLHPVGSPGGPTPMGVPGNPAPQRQGEPAGRWGACRPEAPKAPGPAGPSHVTTPPGLPSEHTPSCPPDPGASTENKALKAKVALRGVLCKLEHGCPNTRTTPKTARHPDASASGWPCGAKRQGPGMGEVLLGGAGGPRTPPSSSLPHGVTTLLEAPKAPWPQHRCDTR